MNDEPLQALGSVAKDHRRMAAVPKSNKRMLEHINRWNKQQSDSQVKDDYDEAAEVTRDSSSDDKTLTYDYLDREKKVCLLCQRQFKTLEVLQRHALESALHQRNLKDEGTCAAGRERRSELSGASDQLSQKMKPAGFTPVAEPDAASSESTYRDRAQERRIVFGIERKWKPGQSKRKELDSEHSKTDRIGAEVLSASHSSGLGSTLLTKMGWTAGKGLGTAGQGRIEPVEALVLQPGAGIGSHSALSAPLTVEEHSARQTRFVIGSASENRAAYMQDRFKEAEKRA